MPDTDVSEYETTEDIPDETEPEIVPETTGAVTTHSHTHSYSTSKITKKATCTGEGVMTYYCSCGATRTQSIPVTGHTMVAKPAIAATCMNEGKSAGEACSVCGYSTQRIISALGHSFSENKCKHCGVKQWYVEFVLPQSKAAPELEPGKVLAGEEFTLVMHIYTNDPGAKIKPYDKIYLDGKDTGHGDSWEKYYGNGQELGLNFQKMYGSRIKYELYTEDGYLIGEITIELV